jgi:hypothetical protein
VYNILLLYCTTIQPEYCTVGHRLTTPILSAQNHIKSTSNNNTQQHTVIIIITKIKYRRESNHDKATTTATTIL